MERTFDASGLALNVAEIDNPGKPEVVLLHGGSARWQYLRDVLLDLSSDYHVIAPDLRGHGRSEHAPGAYGLGDFADDVERLIESRERPVGLFGHSHGGNVALMVGARMPDEVFALAIGDSPFAPESQRRVFARQDSMLRVWSELAGQAKTAIVPRLRAMRIATQDGAAERPAVEVLGEDSAWFDDMAECLARHDPAFLRMLVETPERVHRGFVAETLLAAIRCPTLLLQADETRGGLMSDEEIHLGERYLRRPRHVRLSGVGHGLFVEDRERVVSILNRFFAESLGA